MVNFPCICLSTPAAPCPTGFGPKKGYCASAIRHIELTFEPAQISVSPPVALHELHRLLEVGLGVHAACFPGGQAPAGYAQLQRSPQIPAAQKAEKKAGVEAIAGPYGVDNFDCCAARLIAG